MNRKELIIFSLALSFSLSLSIARSQPALEVEGIFKDSKTKPYALVNGRIVKEGEEIDGAKVIEVKNDSVKFQYEDNIIVKKIGERNIRKVSGIDKGKQKSSAEIFESRMNEIQKYKNDEEKQKAQNLRNRKIEEERQIAKYIDDTDEYWKTALIYRSNNQYDEAIEAFRKSIDCAEQALVGITDEAYRARIRAIIDSRERALKEVELKKELKRQNQFKAGRGNTFSNSGAY